MAKRPITKKAGKRRGRLSLSERKSLFSRRLVNFIPEERRPQNKPNFGNTILSTTLAFLTRGWTRPIFNQSPKRMFVRALKAKKIKRVAEVGPGLKSILVGAADVFKEAECQMFVIGSEEKVEYTRKGIKAIPQHAGRLDAKFRGNLDLVIARNVFSFGGGSPRVGKKEISAAIKNATNGTLDLIKRLSNNKNAIIVLTESSDVLLADRKKIEKNAEILKWEPITTEKNFRFKSSENVETQLSMGWINKNEARVIQEAPNIIVLRKRTPQTKIK